MQKPFYITTTLPYVNAPLHMGHALEFVRVDTIARYKKLAGFDVYFNTGTDEHGLKILEKAKENNLTPQEFTDRGFEIFKEQLKMFGIKEQDRPEIHFIRTTNKKHEQIAKDFWRRIQANGYIYKKNYQAKYCVGCESEKTDSELVDGECPEHPGKELKIINEENYFFKYSAFGEKLLEFYNKNPNFVIPEFRFHEIKNFVAGGLQDFSISRLKEKMSWGIEVPGDDRQVMYVWFDALVNYISTFADDGINTIEELVNSENFKKYWMEGNPTQYCGKDNTRFQSAMWQAMLMAAGLPNSHQIVVNGFITGDKGVRMSKTLGNVVDPRDIVKEYGTDALRYFLLREVGSFEDSPFTIERFKESYNSGLANGLGNLVSRIMKMAEEHLNESIKTENLEIPDEFINRIDNFNIKGASGWIWNSISNLNLEIQEHQPFKIIKTNPTLGKNLIATMVMKLFIISKMLESFLPETSEKIQKLIKENKKPEAPLFLRKE